MSERKSINKYYPPDYNPLEAEKEARRLSKKLKTANKDLVTIRLMTPFSMKCLNCFEYISKGKKFNGKKELLKEKYLDKIKIYRMTIRCPKCSRQIVFRTDPGSADYIIESGGERNFIQQRKEEKKNAGETIEETMKRLENTQDEEDALKNNKNLEKGEQKMNKLEERIERLQKEQEADEQLETLQAESYELRKRYDDIIDNSAKQKVLDNAALDKLAEEAFERKRNNSSEQPNKTLNIQKTSILPATLKKNKLGIKTNKVKKPNKFGIVLNKKAKK